MKIFFTKHSEERMQLRRIAVADIERTMSKPDRSFPGKKRETMKFIRHLNNRRHEVIAKWLPEQNAWLVLSVWVRGEEDRNLNAMVFAAVRTFIRLLVQLIKRVLNF